MSFPHRVAGLSLTDKVKIFIKLSCCSTSKREEAGCGAVAGTVKVVRVLECLVDMYVSLCFLGMPYWGDPEHGRGYISSLDLGCLGIPEELKRVIFLQDLLPP